MSIRQLHRWVVVVVSLVALVGCGSAPRGGGEARLYDGFSGYQRVIQSRSAKARRWFEQGMQMAYGFNHDEAIRSFEEAARHDPESPMPWWGIAYALGININDPVMSDARSEAARAAADEAVARIDAGSPVEAGLVEAVSARYAWPAPADRRGLDEAYARAMGRVYVRFPDDADVATLYAESLMDLQPWDYWDEQGKGKGRIDEIMRVLEGVLARRPNHVGANHFYIHAVEASREPERAVAVADRLGALVPGAGHLVHMPSHIYVRVGRYADAVTTNVAAVAADRAYLKRAPAPRLFAIYCAHNLHFLAYSGMMCGRYEEAIGAARDLERDTPAGPLSEFAPLIEGIMPTTFHVLVRFGKWREVLEEPAYAQDRLVSNAVRHYARAVALSALGRTQEARGEQAAFAAAAAVVPDEWYIFNNPVSSVLPIAMAMIEGELLFREGKRDAAFRVLRGGIAMEDALVYDEPPGWMLPVRHALGALLVSAERYEEAEQVYREDLERHRENGWALVGLERALRAQDKHDEADAVAERLAVAWVGADVSPTSSCYCEPGE